MGDDPCHTKFSWCLGKHVHVNYQIEIKQWSVPDAPDTRCSTPEDWDSDDYWIPQYYKAVTPPRSPWLFFVKKKMEEGNFCPMDAHPVSIADKVKYEKHCNPPLVVEVAGQFDDYSDDDSWLMFSLARWLFRGIFELSQTNISLKTYFSFDLLILW